MIDRETSGLIAIVDDDAAARHALEFLLKVLGHRTASYASAAQFLRSDIETFACLILDHHMPEMTGVDLVYRLRSAHHALPIMLVSGDLTGEVAERAVQAGANLVCDKPPAQPILASFIDSALA